MIKNLNKFESKIRFFIFVITMLSLILGFRAMLFDHAPTAFAAPEEDMSYAWYVPLFSLYVLYVERRKILNSLGNGDLLASLLIVPAIFVGFLGVRGIQLRFEQVSFISLLLIIPWVFYGRELAKKILFPVLFLLFCIPLNSFLDIVTVHLRIFATTTAYVLLKGFGADVVRQGTMLFSQGGDFSIDVAQPCSGIRSIFALMSLTAGYAYFNQRSWLGRAILFSLSIPLAILGNVARIITICLVGLYADGEFALGFYHDYSGYVVFVVAISAMVASGELITRILHTNKKENNEENVVLPKKAVTRFSFLIYCFSSLLVVSSMVLLSQSPEARLCDEKKVNFPVLPNMTMNIEPPSEAELSTLPKDTIIEKRSYTGSIEGQYFISAITGGRSKSSLHRPELCLPSQGFAMRNPRTIETATRQWRVITVESSYSEKRYHAYTFFNQEGFATASHMSRILRDVFDRTLFNRIDRWTMITVNVPICSEEKLLEILNAIGDSNE